jgi:hypothetical protein
MATEDPKADRKAARDKFKKQFELGARTWKKNGGQGAYVPYSLMFGLLGAGKKKLKEEAKLAGRMTSILKSMHSPRSYALPS